MQCSWSIARVLPSPVEPKASLFLIHCCEWRSITNHLMKNSSVSDDLEVRVYAISLNKLRRITTALRADKVFPLIINFRSSQSSEFDFPFSFNTLLKRTDPSIKFPLSQNDIHAKLRTFDPGLKVKICMCQYGRDSDLLLLDSRWNPKTFW